MHVAELCFPFDSTTVDDAASHAIHGLLSALRMNGQICGREWPLAQHNRGCVTTVLLPAPDALDAHHHNEYVRRALAELAEAGFGAMQVASLEPDLDGDPPCDCAQCSAFILITNYLSLESPLRCGDCFGPVPLYTIPPTYQGEFYDLICWQSDAQACDTLWMNSTVLERAALRQVSRHDSPLARTGRANGARIAEATGAPVYYRLFRYGGRSLRSERARRCPECGGAWLLDEPWHRFDFRCDRCLLVSEVAWDVQREGAAMSKAPIS